jgi:hypothetical protein
MLLELILIHPSPHPHLMWTVLSVFVTTQSTFQSTTLSYASPQTQISELNAIQSTPSQQSGGKKKTRNKPKKNNNNEQQKNQTQTPAT